MTPTGLETSSELLLTVAELSIALAGFSGVVLGLRRSRSSVVARQDLFGLLNILVSSGVAMFFSLLPFALHGLGLAEGTAWRATSIALGVVVVAVTARWGYATRLTKPRFPIVYWSLLGMGTALGVVLLATSFASIAGGGSWLPITLLWLLVVAFTQFVAFLLLAWEPPDGRSLDR